MSLSERIRLNVDAVQWVVEEIKEMEATEATDLLEARVEIARLREALEKYADDDHWDWQCAGDGHADGICDLGPFLAAKALEGKQ